MQPENNKETPNPDATNPTSPVQPEASPPTSSPSPTPTVSSLQPLKKKSKSKLLLMLLVLLVLVAGSTAAYFLMRDDSDSSTASKVNNTPIERVDVAVDGGTLDQFFPSNEIGVPTYEIAPQIGEGLVKYSGSKVVPSLATSWVNPDQKTWEFELKQGVKFHNGKSVSAKDVVASVEAAQGTDIYGAYVESITEVGVVDASHVRIRTDKPDALLLKKLVYVTIFDTEASKVASPEFTTGAFTLKTGTEVSPDKLTLVPYEGYHGTKPLVQELVYTYYETQEALTAAIESGKADFYGGISSTTLDELTSSKGLVRTDFNNYGTTLMYLDTTAGKVFADKKVRKAIRLTMDVATILTKTETVGEPAAQVLTPELPGYAEGIEVPKYTLEAAKKAVSDSGYDGRTVKVLYLPELQPRMPLVIEQLKAAGINVEPVEATPETAIDLWVDGAADILSQSYTSDLFDGSDVLRAVMDPDLAPTVKYSNDTLLSKLLSADSEFNEGKRTQILQEVNQELYDEAAVVPLYIPKQTRYHNAKFDMGSTTQLPMNGVTGIDFATLHLLSSSNNKE